MNVGVCTAVAVGVAVFTGVAVSTGVNAVSYTHLRAHETVLDLVCRLLLEKKKIKITTWTREYATDSKTQSEHILQ